jgi:hypothetical protein
MSDSEVCRFQRQGACGAEPSILRHRWPATAHSPIRSGLDNHDFLAIFLSLAEGRVAERLKAPDSKSGVRETVPWVQIPPLPPERLAVCCLRFTVRGSSRPQESGRGSGPLLTTTLESEA